MNWRAVHGGAAAPCGPLYGIAASCFVGGSERREQGERGQGTLQRGEAAGGGVLAGAGQ